MYSQYSVLVDYSHSIGQIMQHLSIKIKNTITPLFECLKVKTGSILKKLSIILAISHQQIIKNNSFFQKPDFQESEKKFV